MAARPSSTHGDSDKPSFERAPFACRDASLKGGRAQKVVLVMVDDDEDDCYLVEAALKETCYDCSFHCLHDGRDVLDYLSRNGRYKGLTHESFPDLILLDLNMPGISGLDVLRKMRTDARFRAIPVVILTTSSQPEDIRSCYELGANSYIVKQSSFNGLASAIGTFMEYWLNTATLPPRGKP